MKQRLFMMVGAPGTGKSTFVLNNMKEDFIYISRDEIRYSFLEEGDDYFAKERKVFNEFILRINEAIMWDDYPNIIIDATHLTKASRAKVLKRLATVDEIRAIVMTTPLEVALERNAKREGRTRVPDDVIKSMYNSFELPTKEEGFDSIAYINENGVAERVIQL
jgi:predicted kinase